MPYRKNKIGKRVKNNSISIVQVFNSRGELPKLLQMGIEARTLLGVDNTYVWLAQDDGHLLGIWFRWSLVNYLDLANRRFIIRKGKGFFGKSVMSA